MPPKPWEVKGGVTITAPQEQLATEPVDATTAAASTSVARPPGARPWEQAGGVGTSYSATPYSGSSYSSPYGGSYSSPYSRPGMYGTSYGGIYGGMPGSMYGSSGMYGSTGIYGSSGMYGSSSMYGSSMYGGGMYGGGMYNRPMYGGGMYGQPGGMYGGPPGMAPGPFGPDSAMPPAPPTAWQTFMSGMNGVMQFFGRLSFLVDENAHAVHFFISALLQLLDRAGSLYGEVARFIIRVLFKRQRALKLPPGQQQPGQPQLPGPPGQPQQQQLAGTKAAAPGLPAASSSMPAATGGGAGSSMTRAVGAAAVGAAAAAVAAGGAPWRPPGLPAGPNRAVGGTPSGPQWDQLWSDS